MAGASYKHTKSRDGQSVSNRGFSGEESAVKKERVQPGFQLGSTLVMMAYATIFALRSSSNFRRCSGVWADRLLDGLAVKTSPVS